MLPLGNISPRSRFVEPHFGQASVFMRNAVLPLHQQRFHPRAGKSRVGRGRKEAGILYTRLRSIELNSRVTALPP